MNTFVYYTENKSKPKANKYSSLENLNQILVFVITVTNQIHNLIYTSQ